MPLRTAPRSRQPGPAGIESMDARAGIALDGFAGLVAVVGKTGDAALVETVQPGQRAHVHESGTVAACMHHAGAVEDLHGARIGASR